VRSTLPSYANSEAALFALRAQADRDARCANVVNCRKMPLMPAINADNDRLRNHLRALDAEFDREMRARGFDPAQAENVALPSHLAALYIERERIRAAMEAAEEKTDD
jgi:hypothetical protein